MLNVLQTKYTSDILNPMVINYYFLNDIQITSERIRVSCNPAIVTVIFR